MIKPQKPLSSKLTKKQTQDIVDSFQNLPANLGIGTNNLMTGSRYALNPITRVRLDLELRYRGSWIAAAAVDLPAEDMTRSGISLTNIPCELADELQEEMIELNIWGTLCEALKWSRLFGGSLLYIMIDGQDPSTPLNMDSIDVGQFKGLMSLDRWQVSPSVSDVVVELGPNFGLPRYYDILASKVLSNTVTRVHHSRMIRFIGIDLPFQQRITEMGWGESVLERLDDRLVAFDSGTMGASQMLYKAHLRTLKVGGLRQLTASGGQALKGLKEQLAFMRIAQSNEGLTVLDATDEFDTYQYNFAGLRDILLTLAEQISGSLQIPMVRLFGQEPGGLSSDGDSALHTYYDNLSKQQELRLRRPIAKIIDLTCRTLTGEGLPKGSRFHFNSLWQMTETERADVASKDTSTIIAALTAQLIDIQTAQIELRNLSNINKVFSNIPDQDTDNGADLINLLNKKPDDYKEEGNIVITGADLINLLNKKPDDYKEEGNTVITGADLIGLSSKGVMR